MVYIIYCMFVLSVTSDLLIPHGHGLQLARLLTMDFPPGILDYITLQGTFQPIY